MDSAQAKWIKVHNAKQCALLGKKVMAFLTSSNILFYDIVNETQLVYSAVDKEKGDGVACIAGCRSSTMFAFAEKCEYPGIFLIEYPSFQKINVLHDRDVYSYQAIAMTESELIIGLSIFPNYIINVWCWRTGRKIASVATGISKSDQCLIASSTHNLICQTWKDGLILWEVAPCYKLCMLMPRYIKEDNLQQPITTLAWTGDGQLYGIDKEASLYAITTDGIGLVSVLEYSSDTFGRYSPLIAYFKGGFAIYGPDRVLRHIKKSDKNWIVNWLHECDNWISNLTSDGTGEVLVAFTHCGAVLKITSSADGSFDITTILFMPRNVSHISVLNPLGDYFVTLDEANRLCLWDTENGNLIECFNIDGTVYKAVSCDTLPIVALCGNGPDNKNGLSLIALDNGKLKTASSITLSHDPIDNIAWHPNGKSVTASILSRGHIFVMKITDDSTMEIAHFLDVGTALSDVWIVEVGIMGLIHSSAEYHIGNEIFCYNLINGRENNVTCEIEGPYREIIPDNQNNILLAAPHLSKNIHILKIHSENSDVNIKLITVISSKHELRNLSIRLGIGCLVTWGLDGLIYLREYPLDDNYWFKIVGCHRYGYGIREAIVCPLKRFIIALTKNRTITMYKLKDYNNPAIARPDTNSFDYENLPELQINDPGSNTWQELLKERQINEETVLHEETRQNLLVKRSDLCERLIDLIEENEDVPDLHRLPLISFHLNTEAQQQMMKQGAEERERAHLDLEALIAAQDRVTDWIKTTCWNKMSVQSTWIHALFTHYTVENYAIVPVAGEFNEKLNFVRECRTIELTRNTDIFKPWNSIAPLKSGSKPIIKGPNNEETEQSREILERNTNVLSGTMSHLFIKTEPYFYRQFSSFSFLQARFQEIISKHNCNDLRYWFNAQFDEMMNVKHREVALVKERNERFRTIISELNKLAELRGDPERIDIKIEDPEWAQDETPERLIKVEPNEISVLPYISPSRIVLPAADLGMQDEFRERALILMMDGVLEKLWQDEIKKDIPKPQCMFDKAPEHYNEEDLKLIFDYEKKTDFQNAEREKYRRLLVAEYGKLSIVLNDNMVRFNSKVKDLQILKMRVETAIGQEYLKLMRMRCNGLQRIKDNEKVQMFRKNIADHERQIERLQSELKLIQEHLSECHSAYEALAARDRTLDKNFKSNFPDLAPVVTDQCYRMFKRRPKWQQRATITAAGLLEIGQTCLSGERSIFMHPDGAEYVKAMDALDSINNMPPVMDENLWLMMCKLRRIKIENEMRMRAMAIEAASTEATANSWSKCLASRRAVLVGAQRAQKDHFSDMEASSRNPQIQLVLKAGQIELPTTGHLDDFQDAALLKNKDVQQVNDLILKAGNQKINEMKGNMNFKRGILGKEWEHTQLKMRIRHLEEELYNVNRIKVTKELQQYLRSCYRGTTDEQHYASLERNLESSKIAFNKLLHDNIQRAEDMEIRVHSMENKNKALDEMINKLKLDVAEKRLTHPVEINRQKQQLNKKMAILRNRRRLAMEVQQNHSVIMMLQTELELLRLKTYPTLAGYH